MTAAEYEAKMDKLVVVIDALARMMQTIADIVVEIDLDADDPRLPRLLALATELDATKQQLLAVMATAPTRH